MEMADVFKTHDTYGGRIMSLAEFFNNLNRGQVVRVTRWGTPLVYTGARKDDGTIILSTQTLSEIFLVDLHNDAGEWMTVMDDDGNFLEMCSDTCDAIDQYIAEWKFTQQQRREIDRMRNEIQRINDNNVIAKLRNDIQLINTELNRRAEQYDWCNEYEEILDNLNENLSDETDLIGRKREYNIRVTVKAEWDVYLDVEATSEKDAIEQLRQLDSDEMFHKVRQVQSYPDNIEVDEI
jgi:hypothetical protein